MKIVAVDIGNSLSKIMIDKEIFALNYGDNFENKLYEIFDKNKLANNKKKIIVSSVNDATMKKMYLIFDALKIKYENVNDNLSVQNIIDFFEISGMGNDRKLGLIGATNYVNPPFITVDCGTAITVNVVDKNLKCLGGIIFPGLNTQAKSLKTFTSQLPQININDKIFNNKTNIFSDGKNTVDAITIGILSSTSGGIINFVNSTVKNNLLLNTSLLFTGGNGDLMRKICSNYFFENKNKLLISDINFVPNLVLEGIMKLGSSQSII